MTPKLPPALSDWQAQLALFPYASACALGPPAQRLAAAIGLPALERLADGGEPDGFDGLTRRGLYDRLLITEWALADAAPDEFLRRAASGEHLFLNLRRVERASSRRALVFFDAGPNQLGPPRLAHLAALIALARRAEAAGLPLAWGIAQQPDAPLVIGVTRESVMRLLEARTPYELTEAQANRLLEYPASADDDAWLVGGPRLGRFPQLGRFAQLWIEESLADERSLVVTVHPRQGAGASCVLDAPDANTMTRLLRDPFAAARSTPTLGGEHFRPASNLVFCQHGRYVFALQAEGNVLRYPVGNSPQAESGKPKLLERRRPGQVFAAGHFRRGSILATSYEDGRLRLDTFGKRPVPSGGFQAFAAPGASADSPGRLGALRVLCLKGEYLCLVADGQGRLCQLSQGDRAVPVDTEVKAWLTNRDQLLYARHRTDGQWAIAAVEPDATAVPAQLADPPPASVTVIPGPAGEKAWLDISQDAAWLAALEMRDGGWMLADRDGHRAMPSVADADVVGVGAALPVWKETGIGLIALDADRRRLWMLGYCGWRKLLLQTGAPMTAVTVRGSLVAFATEAGEVVVHSLVHEAPVYRLLAR